MLNICKILSAIRTLNKKGKTNVVRARLCAAIDERCWIRRNGRAKRRSANSRADCPMAACASLCNPSPTSGSCLKIVRTNARDARRWLSRDSFSNVAVAFHGIGQIVGAKSRPKRAKFLRESIGNVAHRLSLFEKRRESAANVALEGATHGDDRTRRPLAASTGRSRRRPPHRPRRPRRLPPNLKVAA